MDKLMAMKDRLRRQYFTIDGIEKYKEETWEFTENKLLSLFKIK